MKRKGFAVNGQKIFRQKICVRKITGAVLGIMGALLLGAGTAQAAELNSSGELNTYVKEELTSEEEEALVGGYSYNSNAHHQEYTSVGRWARKVYSYLVPNGTGFTRVEYVEGKILVEEYDKDFKKFSSMNLIEKEGEELGVFAGFYAGKEANFIVYGQTNFEQDDEVEVVRVVKYGKDWKRLGAASLYGANTMNPFMASSLRMCESGDALFIRTGHNMYRSSDGVSHQANMSIKVNTTSMQIEDSFYRIWNIRNGYVSHCFNQFIQTAGGQTYAVDHGDAHPRSIVLGRYSGEDVSSQYEAVELLRIQKETYMHYNDTGVAVGGFEISDTHCLVAGCSVVQDENWEDHIVRNIWLSSTPMDDFSETATEFTWITDFKEGQDYSVTNPHLVKIDSDNYVLLWELAHEGSFKSENYPYRGKVQMVTLDGEGKVTGEIMEFSGVLSDCKPIVNNNQLVWYVTNNEANPGFYVFDISYKGERASLKLNKVTPSGITLSQDYAYMYKGWTQELLASMTPDFLEGEFQWSSSNEKVATVKDGLVTAIDKGTAVITVRSGEFYAECNVEVPEVSLSRLEINEVWDNLEVDKTLELVVTCYPVYTTDDTTVTWSSADESIATVSQTGVVTGVSEGWVTITAKVGNLSVTCDVNVFFDPYSVTPSPAPTQSPSDDTDEIPAPGETQTPSATETPAPNVTPTPTTTTEPTIPTNPTPTPVPEEVKEQVNSFATRMYTVALKRDPDKEGLADWISQLLSHERDGAGLAFGFIMSAEFTNKNLSDEEYVETLYYTFFDREPDEGGKTHWLTLLSEGKERGFVLAGFVNSTEFDNLCNSYGIVRGIMREDGSAVNPGVRGFVERCYDKALGRAGDKEGIDNWVNNIVRGERTPEDVAKLFFLSEEYINKKTADEVYVEALYQTFMGRASDEGGKKDWLSRLAGGTSREDVLEGFSKSPEFGKILESYGL